MALLTCFEFWWIPYMNAVYYKERPKEASHGSRVSSSQYPSHLPALSNELSPYRRWYISSWEKTTTHSAVWCISRIEMVRDANERSVKGQPINSVSLRRIGKGMLIHHMSYRKQKMKLSKKLILKWRSSPGQNSNPYKAGVGPTIHELYQRLRAYLHIDIDIKIYIYKQTK